MLVSSPEARMLTPQDTRRPWNVIPFPTAAIRRLPPPPTSPEPPRRPPLRAIAWSLLAISCALALGVLGNAWWTVHQMSARIARMPDAFTMPEAARPVRRANAARSVNVLIAGLDGEGRTGQTYGARSDAIMVLHLDADRHKA